MNVAKAISKRLPFHYGFVIIACCCLMMGVNVGLTFSCAGIFYKPVTEALSIPTGLFGLYMTVMYVASALTLPFAGKLLSKYGARRVFTLSSVLNGLALVMMGCVSSVLGFYAAGALLGISIAFLLYMSYPTLVNGWFASRMGLMMGICVAASGIGGMVFNPLGAWVIGTYGWRAGYYVFGAIVLATVTPLLYLLLVDTPSDIGLSRFGAKGSATWLSSHNSGNLTNEESDGLTLSQIRRMPVFYVLILFAFIMMGCSTLNLFIPGFAQTAGYSLESAGMAAAASMTGVTIGKLALGWINDRSCLTGVLISTLGGALGTALILVCASWLPVLLAGCFLFGWCYAGVTVQTAMLTRKVAGAKDYSLIFSYISIALSAGGAIASGAWGLISDGYGYGAVFSLGCILLVIATLLGIYALVWSKRTLKVGVTMLLLPLMLLGTGCLRNEVTVELDLNKDDNTCYQINYYASDKKNRVHVERMVTLSQGKAKVELSCVNPVLISISALGGKETMYLYAKRGEKIKIVGDSQQPDSWRVEGDGINARWSKFRTDNLNALRFGSPASVNKMISDYVNHNPDDMLSMLMVMTGYDRSVDEEAFRKVWNKLAADLKSPQNLALTGRVGFLENIPVEIPALPKRFSARLRSDSVVTVKIADAAKTLFWFRANRQNSKFRADVDTIRGKFRKNPGRSRLVTISFDADSAAMLREARFDSVTKAVPLWDPEGEAGNLAVQFAVPRTPWYVVADSTGKALYRGNNAKEALKALGK